MSGAESARSCVPEKLMPNQRHALENKSNFEVDVILISAEWGVLDLEVKDYQEPNAKKFMARLKGIYT